MNDFESIARKLRALQSTVAHPGTPQGEKEAAQARIEALCTRHGLRMEDTWDTETVVQELTLDSLDELILAAQLLAYIAGHDSWKGKFITSGQRPQGFNPKTGKRRKPLKYWTLSARMLKIEAADWAASVAHYRPILKATTAVLKRELATARRALKNVADGVIQKFRIFVPDFPSEAQAGKASDRDMEATFAACRAAQGERWQGKTSKLTDSFLLTDSTR